MNACLRSFNITEPCPLDFKTAVALLGGFLYLKADVLTFSVAICPDTQGFGVPRLLLDVLGDLLLVLLGWCELETVRPRKEADAKSLPRMSQFSQGHRINAQGAGIPNA